MNVSSRRKSRQFRLGYFEQLESRKLLATLFYEDADPLTPGNFTTLDARIFGSSVPWEFHSGNTLYFSEGNSKVATTRPISLSNATIEFRLRLGDGSPYFGKIGPSEEVTLLAIPQGGRNAVVLKVFPVDEKGFSSRDQWNLAKFEIPPIAESPGTIFKWYHTSFSFAAWAMDEIKVVGDPFQFRLEQVSPIRNSAVDKLMVEFVNPIDSSTLSASDLTLLRDNVPVPLDSSITIQALGGNKYSINGLTKFTRSAGQYRLTLRGESILDASGQALQAIQRTSWLSDQVPPRLIDVVDVTPDPRTGGGKAVSSIDLVFSEPLDLTSLDYLDLTLTRDSSPADLIRSRVLIQATSNDRTYRVSNLETLTSRSGSYVFSVDGLFQDLAGNVGGNVLRDDWLANDPPEVVVGGTLVFPEDSRPLAIAGAGLITDGDSPIFRNGKLTVSIANPKPNDALSIFHRPNSITRIGVAGNQVYYDRRSIGTVTGGIGSTPLVIALNANASTIAVQSLLRNINFQHTGDIPIQETRIIQVFVEDGEGGRSQTGTMRVLLSPVNDAPVLALNPNSPIAYAKNASPILIAASATVSDVDNPNFYNGTLVVQVTRGRDNTEVLGLNGPFSIANQSVHYQGIEIGLLNATGLAGRPLTIRFNAKATQAIVQELLQSIQFSTLQNRLSGLRTIDILLRDGRGGVSNTVSMSVDVR